MRNVPKQKSGMGRTFLDRKKCVDYQEEKAVMCWTCYERYTLKGTAIVLGGGGYIPEVRDECVGCGVCEYVCPIHAISVVPTRRLKPAQDGEGK